MILLKCCYRSSLWHRRGTQYSYKFFSTIDLAKANLSKLLNICENKAEYMCLKYPVLKKMDALRMKQSLDALKELGFSKEVLSQEPLFFSILPITLKYRYKVLEECGIVKISSEHLLAYLAIVKQSTIGELKRSQRLQAFVNIENRLASFMTQWPTSLTTSICGNLDEMTLYSLRLKLIQRYLELVLDITSDEFYRGIETYPTIKHRPLQVINQTLNILQSVIRMPSYKIKSNMYLIHVDPDNLNQIIYKLRSIGGIDVKEVIRMYPRIATKKYSSLIEIQQILQEYGIGNEAQIRCFDIYTLGPDTIRKRLDQARQIPEFNTFYRHPRFLKMIHHKNTAMHRLQNLYRINKKCLSLNILSGSAAHYDAFEKAPGDRSGKGKDLLFCISQSLGKKFSPNEIRKIINRHPYWVNIPLVQVKYVYQKLSTEFSDTDIFQNCAILLYPWSKIKDTLNLLKDNGKKSNQHHYQDYLDVRSMNQTKKLSLVLYLLEKNHYFSGNGVWTEEEKSFNEIIK